MPRTRLSALRHGSSRYSIPTRKRIEHMFDSVEIADGVRRITFPMPMSPGHVHGYLLPVEEGYVLVDTGLGLPDLAERWLELLPGLDRLVAAIVITHFHPDH